MKTTTNSAPTAEIRAAISKIRHQSQQKQNGGESYKVDRHCADYLKTYPKLQKKVFSFLNDLRARGEDVVYVDICGRAKLGLADFNYSFSLQENRWKWLKIPERAVGDIFSAKDFYGFLEIIKAKGQRPSFVTCEPIAGFEDYYDLSYRKVINQRLENNLRAMIKLLRPGGFIYISSHMCPVLQGEGHIREFITGVPTKERKSALLVQEVCKSMRCSVDVVDTLGGIPDFLIRKWLR